MQKFNFIDLFAGIGGFHHALHSLGGKCVMACEMDSQCQRVYRRSFPEFPASLLVSNIRSITRKDILDENSTRSSAAIHKLVPDHDVLCAGFPCQPFSKSGNQKGVNEARGTLFFNILKVIESKKPELVLLENVRNLVGPKHISDYKKMVKLLRQLGYVVSAEPTIISPHEIPEKFGGTPQHRERVFIGAIKSW